MSWYNTWRRCHFGNKMPEITCVSPQILTYAYWIYVNSSVITPILITLNIFVSAAKIILNTHRSIKIRISKEEMCNSFTIPLYFICNGKKRRNSLLLTQLFELPRIVCCLKTQKFKIQETVLSPEFLVSVEVSRLHLKEEYPCRLRGLENKGAQENIFDRRGITLEGNGGNCIMRSLIICTPCQMYL
jgi:hypothetical protein